METVLAKLAKLMMEHKSTNLIDLSKDTAFLRDELCTVNALLVKLEDEDELNPLVKDWSNQVRELGYDIEDCIDDFTHRVADHAESKAGFVEKISHYVSALRARLEAAKQIKELKTRLREINERRKRYKLDCCISGSRSVGAVDPRMPALYREPSNLVGVDGPREELVRWVTDEKEQLKVVPILGYGGLGKTTLANEVYRAVKGQFACHAFVSVSQRPDMTRLLHSLRSKLCQQESTYICEEVKDLIDDIRKCLQHERYLVIIDDVWDTATWDIIRCTFPENNLRSRSIVTTRIENVARACCTHQECFYRLKPLSTQDSKILLFDRTFGSEHACPWEIKKISAEILRKCGGLPLAILAVASILASRPTRKREDWENIRSSLDFKSQLNGMRRILNLSYKDLPHHLKACFLYLGMYPEDHIIQKVDLIRQWVAEGIVNNSHRRGMDDLANSYFSELVNRSLIEPEEIDHNGDVLSCRVHDMMLDLIIKKCTDENFIRVVFDSQGIWELCNSKVRRLSLKLNGAKGSTTSAARAISGQPEIRSFALFGTTASIPVCASILPESKFLRVLILDLHEVDCRNQHEARIDLTSINQLFLLRYMKIDARVSIVKLPTEIRGMHHLETIELHCRVISYPSDMFHLPGLLHLIVTSLNRFPDGICDAKNLRTLQYFGLLENSLDNIRGLGELMNLRILKIRCLPKFLLGTTTERPEMGAAMDALYSSLAKLGSRNLKHLSVVRYPEICADTLSSVSPTPHHLETLDLLAWWFSRVPMWLAELRNLCSLDLCVRDVMEEDVAILSALPSLRHLQFKVQQVPKYKIIMRKDTGHFFPVLHNFQFKCERRVSLQLVRFEPGAMPNLRRIQIETTEKLLEWDGSIPAGMEHLLSLKEICLSIVHGQGTEHERIDAECAFRSIAQLHPSCPTITII